MMYVYYGVGGYVPNSCMGCISIDYIFLRDHIPLKYWSGLKFFDCTFYNYV